MISVQPLAWGVLRVGPAPTFPLARSTGELLISAVELANTAAVLALESCQNLSLKKTIDQKKLPLRIRPRTDHESDKSCRR